MASEHRENTDAEKSSLCISCLVHHKVKGQFQIIQLGLNLLKLITD